MQQVTAMEITEEDNKTGYSWAAALWTVGNPLLSLWYPDILHILNPAVNHLSDHQEQGSLVT